MANEFIARNGVIALANSTISGSLSVTNSVSGSIFTGSFVGGLTGTSSYASLALTASYATSAVSASYFSGSISNAVFATSASYAATASYALNAGAGGGGTVGGQALLTQSIAATTWSFNHNLGTTYPVVTVYDSTSNTVIIPQNIVPSGSNDMKIYFSSPKSGYATAVAGGGYFVTNNGTTRKLTQSTPAVTWSFVHNIGDQWPSFQVFDSNNNVVIPANIRAVDTYTAEIQFAYSASGTAVATLGGGIGVGDVITIPSASSTWSIQHNLNTTYPIVTIWESGSNQIIQPDTISSVDANNILVTFTTPVKGFANVSRAGSVISGSTDWNLLINKPNVGVVYSQSTAASTWSIAHNLGTQFPLVTVYDSSNTVVIPQSIVGVDANNITITFPSPQSGTVNLSKAGNYISGSILWQNITNNPFNTTGSVTAMSGSLIITGSLTVSGSGTLNNVGPANFTGSVNVTGSLNTIGTITATTLVVQTITSSVSQITGSTQFGSLISNTHQFTGSMFVSGNLQLGTVAANGVGISSPVSMSMGSTFGTNTVGTNFKLKLFEDGLSNRYGLGVSSGLLEVAAAGNIGFFTSGSTSERMRIDLTGNVGIGTSSPSNILHASASLPRIISDTSTRFAVFNLYYQGAEKGAFVLDNQNKLITVEANGDNTYDLRFNVGGSERARITSGGNVGIGTSSPSDGNGFGRIIDLNGTGAAAYYARYASSSTLYSLLGQDSGYTYLLTKSTPLLFFTNNAEAVRITTAGRVFIGTTTGSPGASGFDTRSLHVNSEVISMGSSAGVFFENRSGGTASSANWYGWYNTSGTTYLYTAGTGNVGNFNMSTGNYTATSDINRKKDIELYTNSGLDAILGLKPTLYRMKNEDESVEKHLGFVAQEVKDFIPQAYVETIAEEKDGGVHIGLDYQAITVNLVKAIQELTARVQELENK